MVTHRTVVWTKVCGGRWRSPHCRCPASATWWRRRWPRRWSQAALRWLQGRWWTPVPPLGKYKQKQQNSVSPPFAVCCKETLGSVKDDQKALINIQQNRSLTALRKTSTKCTDKNLGLLCKSCNPCTFCMRPIKYKHPEVKVDYNVLCSWTSQVSLQNFLQTARHRSRDRSGERKEVDITSAVEDESTDLTLRSSAT